MKFAILGAGALGTILGAHLSRAGHEVAMIVRGERARVLQRQGLVLNGLSDIKSRPTVIDDPKKLRETGTLIIATKAIDSARSLDTLRHLDLDQAFSVQNGVLKNELLAKVFGFSRVLGAMADFSGELLANGEVKFTRNVALHLGEEKGGLSPRVEELASAIDAAGVRCVAAPDIRTREWSKFAGWIAQFPLAVLTRQITWKFLMDERSAAVIVRHRARGGAARRRDESRAHRHAAAAGAQHRARQRRAGHRNRPRHRPEIPRHVAGTSHVGAAGRAAWQPARVRRDPGIRARQGTRARCAHAHARHLLPHHLGGASMKQEQTMKFLTTAFPWHW